MARASQRNGYIPCCSGGDDTVLRATPGHPNAPQGQVGIVQDTRGGMCCIRFDGMPWRPTSSLPLPLTWGIKEGGVGNAPSGIRRRLAIWNQVGGVGSCLKGTQLGSRSAMLAGYFNFKLNSAGRTQATGNGGKRTVAGQSLSCCRLI